MVVARNEITGDKLVSKKNSSAYEDNYDNIFRNKKDPICDVCGKVLSSTKECAWTSCPLNWDEKRVDIIGQNGPTGEHYEGST